MSLHCYLRGKNASMKLSVILAGMNITNKSKQNYALIRIGKQENIKSTSCNRMHSGARAAFDFDSDADLPQSKGRTYRRFVHAFICILHLIKSNKSHSTSCSLLTNSRLFLLDFMQPNWSSYSFSSRSQEVKATANFHIQNLFCQSVGGGGEKTLLTGSSK